MKYYTVEDKHKSIYKTFAIYYICMVVFCLLRIFSSKIYNIEGMWGEFLFSFLVQIVVLFLLPLCLYTLLLKVKPKAIFKTCNFEKINIQTILISFALGILCFFINVAVSSLFSGILTFTGYRYIGSSVEGDYSIGNFFFQILIVAIMPAFCEEFLHRGIVLQGIKHMGFKRAIFISSLLFGLLHFNVGQVAYAFVIGLILGFVAVVSKNILPAMIIHFVNNFINVYLEFAEARGWVFGNILGDLQKALSSGNGIWVFICTAIFMIIVVALLCLFIWLLYKQSMLRKVNRAIKQVYYSPTVDKDARIVVDRENEIRDLLENNTLLNLTYKKMDNPIDIVLPKEKYRYKVKPKDEIFLWASIILGGLVTLFTYIWGLL